MKDKKITFAIDCDEVLRSLLNNMVSLYNREFNDNMKYDDVKDFVVDISFPKIKEATGITASQWFFQEHSTELFSESEALPKVKEAMKILQKIGDVVIVTYQKSLKNKIETLNWLEEHEIFPSGVCFLKDKTLIHTTYFIDDNDWNFIGCNAKVGILIDAPYNKDTDLTELLSKSNCEYIIRHKSLYHFAKAMVEKEKLVERMKKMKKFSHFN